MQSGCHKIWEFVPPSSDMDIVQWNRLRKNNERFPQKDPVTPYQLDTRYLCRYVDLMYNSFYIQQLLFDSKQLYSNNSCTWIHGRLEGTYVNRFRSLAEVSSSSSSSPHSDAAALHLFLF